MGDSLFFSETFTEQNYSDKDYGSNRRPLTQEEVVTLQEIHGPNTIKSGRKRTWYRIFFAALLHPFNLLLIFLATISGVALELKTMGMMLLMVILSSILRFYQEYKSEAQAQGLLKFVASKVLVIRYDPVLRKEIEFQIPNVTGLVPGDWIRLAPGDLVPADVEVVEDKEFYVSQATFSGEPLPVHKFKQVASESDHFVVPSMTNCTNYAQPWDLNSHRSPMDHSLLKDSQRSSLESTRDARVPKSKQDLEAMSSDLNNPHVCFLGSAVISGAAVCRVVRIGTKTLFGQFAELLARQEGENPFKIGVHEISTVFFWTSLIMAMLVFVLQALLTWKWYAATIFALSVAVGLTPEMLPMVVNTTLAAGAMSLSRRRCIVKKLDAVVNIGAINILCTDKTGTLTTSRVSLRRCVNKKGISSVVPLRLGFLNSHFQSVQDSPLDSAIVHYFHQQNLQNFNGFRTSGGISPVRKFSSGISHGVNVGFASRFNLLDELPFDFVRRRMSVILHDHVQESAKAILICKGAVEEVLDICTSIIKDDSDTEDIVALTSTEFETEPISGTVLRELKTLNEELIGEGFRLLAVAFRSILLQDSYTKRCENNFTFAGYLAFIDPPKDSARAAIQRLTADGVEVKVMSGDCPLVCRKVCEEIGMKFKESDVITGDELRDIKQPALLEFRALTCTIFAKLTPVQKADLVRILQMNGNVVGFLGDGINDAAAVAEADVGISVDTGTDVAKESSDIILLDKDLTVLADAVIIGRKTFGNAMKYMVTTVSSNFGNVFSILIASLWLPFQPIGSFHLLVQNFLYDFSQISIPWDNMDEDYLMTSHTWSTVGILKLMLFMGPLSSVFDIITFLFMYFYLGITTAEDKDAIRVFQTTWFTVGLLTQSAIVHMLRTPKVPLFQSRASTPVILMTLLVIIVGLSLPFIPSVSEWMGLVQLPLSVYTLIAGVVISYCIVAQLMKIIYLGLFNRWY